MDAWTGPKKLWSGEKKEKKASWPRSVLQPWWWFWRDAPVVVSQADRADAFAKIGNIFPQKLPQTNKGTSGIYGNRNKTDFSGPVKFLLLSPPPKEICCLCLILLWEEGLVSGQIPFDVCPFSRISGIKGGESWIKANLLLPDFCHNWWFRNSCPLLLTC